MTKAQLETKLRNECLEILHETLDNKYGCDVLPVSASEIALPVTDAEGNEKWIGYAVAEDYAIDCEEKAQKKADVERKKQAKIARDEKARAEKKALAEANKNLKELRKVKLDKPKDEEEGDDYSKEYAPHELADMLN